jgi:hypothetical protein
MGRVKVRRIDLENEKMKRRGGENVKKTLTFCDER